MTEDVKDGNVTYRSDKYRVPTGYNWLPASGNQESKTQENNRVSTNNIYKRAVKNGKFFGSYSDFLALNSDIVKKYQGEDQKVSEEHVPVIISMISPGEAMVNSDGPTEIKTTIMGVKPWVFYTGLAVVLTGAGFGIYKLLSSKK